MVEKNERQKVQRKGGRRSQNNKVRKKEKLEDVRREEGRSRGSWELKMGFIQLHFCELQKECNLIFNLVIGLWRRIYVNLAEQFL